MTRFWKVLDYARRLFWFLDVLTSPEEAALALLSQPRVKRWLERQPPEDQQKIHEAAPLVVGAILAALD